MAASIAGSAVASAQTLEDIEIDLLLEGMFRYFGHDFRGYRREPLRERLRALMRDAGLSTISALQERILHDRTARELMLLAFSSSGRSTLFDDADYFHALRTVAVPLLRSCPSPRIWIAECLSAEEACSLAILLAEERLHDRTQIYATAANEAVLREAKQGAFPLGRLSHYAENYRRSGGKAELADYIERHGGQGVFSEEIRGNITWAQYNLATDASFNEFQLIICRHALSDFDMPLQRRTLQLFHDSMPLFGILNVGDRAAIAGPPFVVCYKTLSEQHGLYRRVV